MHQQQLASTLCFRRVGLSLARSATTRAVVNAWLLLVLRLRLLPQMLTLSVVLEDP